MAESLLFSLADSLIGKLSSRAVHEASLALGVSRDLQQMKQTMALIKVFLLDAEQKTRKNNALIEWLRQIKHVFSDAEDIVDDFECEALRNHVVNTHGSASRKVRRFFSSSNPLVYRHKMAHGIKDINERLDKVAAQRNMFGLQINENDTRVVHVNPSTVIGREHDKHEILKLLLQQGLDKCLFVIPIVGMGGLGKTTLAKLVFNDTSVDQCFPLKMWVCVSNDFELRNVLIKILNSTPNPSEENFKNFEMEQLQNRLRNTLEHQKFLLVLDDVWNEDRTRWDELKEIIDVGVHGSKILVTTRSHSTAKVMGTKSSIPYHLERLSEEDSFDLFVRLAFEEGEDKKHPQLLEIGKEIVRKCGGIPLAVTTLGSSLISRIDRKEWEPLKDNAICATESLIQKLASHTVEEASLALGVHRDLQHMKDTVALIKAVLLDAEQKKLQSRAIEWQMRRAFSDAQDIVDNLECEALRKHVFNTHDGSVSGKVRRFFSNTHPLVYRLKIIRDKIKDINKRLDKFAYEVHEFYSQIIDKDATSVALDMTEMTPSHVDPSYVIGREHDKEKILELLLQDDKEKRLSVISIVGMEGWGKTTLAKLLFNDTTIDECFSLKIWVHVSDDFGLRNVLTKILNSIPNPTNENFETFHMPDLQNHLRNTLYCHKFLLVLDDLWNLNPTEWFMFTLIIDVGVEGSKLLVTTRNHSIDTIMHTKSSNSYLLEGLSEEDSFSLFIKFTFQEGEEKTHPELLEMGKEIVKKCGGIPLKVRTLGSSLFLKYDKKVWEFAGDNAIWNLLQHKKDIWSALILSYNNLPSYLKPCFASFSLFPEDHEFTSFDVTMLWEALGFLLPCKESETLNDVSNQFLRELQSRSFLTDFLDLGGTYTFKLHRLMFDLVKRVAQGEFQTIYLTGPYIYEHVQHLRLMENNLLDEIHVPSGIKTIFFPLQATNEAFLNDLVSRCKHLRILDIVYSEYESLPRSIGKLKHLRYLCLECNIKLKRLPDSVCELQNLQVLDLAGCTELQELPKGIRKLISLRQLFITTRQPDFPEKEIAYLTSLEDLRFYDCNKLESFSEVIQFSSLKTLAFNRCGRLKSLSFHAIGNLENFTINECEKLELSMGLGNDEIPHSYLKSITLERLPQLVTLPQWMQGSVRTLRSLVINGCKNLKELPQWLSSLIGLKVLKIYYCPKLLSFPNSMHHLRNLEYLEIKGCPELCKRCQREVGQDWHKILHIKKVIIHREVED